MLTPDTSAQRITRSTLAQWSRKQDGDGQLGHLVRLLDLLELRRLGQGAPHPVADRDHEDREEERDPPAPAVELLVGERGDRDEDEGREDQAGLGAAQREAGEEASSPFRGVLEGQRVRAALLTRGRQALHDAEQDQQDRREHADGRIRRQGTDEERRRAHQQQRQDQHLLAAHPVTEVTDDDGADRTGHVRDAEGGQGEQGRGGRVAVGEEHRREDQAGRGAVDEEVVVLEHAADEAGEGGLARNPFLDGATGGGGGAHGRTPGSTGGSDSSCRGRIGRCPIAVSDAACGAARGVRGLRPLARAPSARGRQVALMYQLVTYQMVR